MQTSMTVSSPLGADVSRGNSPRDTQLERGDMAGEAFLQLLKSDCSEGKSSANLPRGCLLPSLVSMFHVTWRTPSTPELSALDDWATRNRVHAMYFTRLASNTCGKGWLINWRLGGFPSMWVVKKRAAT